MPLPNIFDIADFLMWWRLSVGLFVTGLLFLLALTQIPQETVAWVVAITVGIVGGTFSFRWQHQADVDK